MADSTAPATATTTTSPPAQWQGTLAFGNRRHSPGRQVTQHRELLPPSLSATAAASSSSSSEESVRRPPVARAERQYRIAVRAWEGRRRRAQQDFRRRLLESQHEAQQREEENEDIEEVNSILGGADGSVELGYEGMLALLEFMALAVEVER
ncbi:uncharacterized protein CLAFUR5_04137 [Fulvia fulva]|uniref:Uncharacterized protein n=1 Tax=Passalora fulva TaxID=5499 RepID=A0A9Q8LF16_PASFU|nr:uncharacterized protein CLAFUR5_04137 [Fulvia fulva]UJO16204.1 hypothetical protein CLAFUR5_04137 [Fulvia fulva]